MSSKVKPARVFQRTDAADADKLARALLGAVPDARPPAPGMPTAAAAAAPAIAPSAPPSENVADYPVGSTVQVPLHLIGENPFNARVFYVASEIDDMALSLQAHGQDVSAEGWVEDGRVLLIDGGKRLRGARAAGLPSLRVEIKRKPANSRDLYLASRRINLERSAHTVLDDAVRFQALLKAGVFESQDEIAQRLQISKSAVSQVMAINLIPERLLARMKEHPQTSSHGAAYELSRIFVAELARTDPDRAEQLAAEVIDEVVRKEMTRQQVRALIESRLQGPQRRVRSEIRELRLGAAKGQLKVVEERGQLEFSIRALPAEDLQRLVAAVERLFHADAAPASTER
ncbi:ParB/RepB/Spo0J family partition protein [Caldimonas tepidiphila]|uniref:ParB/RepB/Spo0J family partition protein n=1 Tax=Caldimonas tepidiphila TaxID=2315841 RepID=UPI000E5B86DC|nr:ParB N-terminal domain-containing protein [Caldimonas tepidiphila]